MRRWRWLFLLAVAVAPLAAMAEPSPPPQFESGYKLPVTTQAPPRAAMLGYIDVAVLAGALVLASLLAHRWRSRKGILVLSLASLAYFGLYRKGCICAIGAIQNIALGLADPSYIVPLPAIAFFVLPLAFALVSGRVFCGAVCPMGAIQELVLLRPVKLPLWAQHGLRMIAYVYLAAAVLFAATASAFVICQYDPFVGFFRLSAGMAMLVLGGAVLLLGLFVARPYCRFLCPLGVLLGHTARVSMTRVKITPADCIQCRLCEDSCPYGAILPSTQVDGEPPAPARPSSVGKGVLAALILAVPILAIAGGYLGQSAATLTSQVNPTVRLAQRMYLEENHLVKGTINESDAFRKTRRSVDELNAQAMDIYRQFVLGGWIAGGALGLMLGLQLVQLTIRRRREGYEADRSACLACGRCFEYCPVHRAAKENRSVEQLVSEMQAQRDQEKGCGR